MALTCALAVTALGGCGNAFESLSMSDWRESGVAETPPLTGNGEFQVTTLVPGEGRTAKAGDLVKAEVLVTTARAGGAAPAQRTPRTIWVWLGREADAAPTSAEMETFGYAGAPRPRRAFIGRQLHERFRMQLTAGADPSYDSLPLNGIIGLRQAALATVAFVDEHELQPREWPALNLRADGDGESSAEVTVLAICDAKLLRRTATLRQKGFIMSSGDAQYDFNREGTIGWTAIDAECPAPDGHVRFEAGPFYHPPSLGDRSRLADWSATYVQKRPAKDHPEEWEPWKP
jgi:hypothetical protein